MPTFYEMLQSIDDTIEKISQVLRKQDFKEYDLEDLPGNHGRYFGAMDSHPLTYAWFERDDPQVLGKKTMLFIVAALDVPDFNPEIHASLLTDIDNYKAILTSEYADGQLESPQSMPLKELAENLQGEDVVALFENRPRTQSRRPRIIANPSRRYH